MPSGNSVKTQYANTLFRQFQFDSYPLKQKISSKQTFMLLGAVYQSKRSSGTSNYDGRAEIVIGT